LGRRKTQRLYIEKINKDKKYKMKKVIIILVVVFMAMNSYCQNIFISGNGQDIKGKTIRLAIVKDRLSMLEKDVDETVLGKEDTSFNFNLTLSSPTEVIIKVDLFDYRFIACIFI
jgi:predicted small secreted protein